MTNLCFCVFFAVFLALLARFKDPPERYSGLGETLYAGLVSKSSKSASQQSASRRSGESASRQVSKLASQQVGGSASRGQRVSGSATGTRMHWQEEAVWRIGAYLFGYVDDTTTTRTKARYKLGDYATLDGAVAACEAVVDNFSRTKLPWIRRRRSAMRPTRGWPDPFIVTDDRARDTRRSAWKLCQGTLS